MGVDAYLRELFEPLMGTHVDTYVWCFGIPWFYYNSKYGKFGDYILESEGKFHDVMSWRVWRNLKDLIESGNDPPKLIVNAAQDIGLETFASLRMNDAHDAYLPPEAAGRIKADHPEWLIGEPGKEYERDSIKWWMRKAFNYAVPEVRSLIRSIIDEITDYGFDGMELDFMSHPFIFRPGEEEAHRDDLTDLIRDVRRLIDQKAGSKEKPRLLMARVPENIDRCLRIGIDVETWIKEALVDMLSIGRCYMPFSIPTREWIEAVKGTSCKIYPSINMSIGAPPHRKEYNTIEALRAFAMLHLSEGAHGIYLFNFFVPHQAGGESIWEALKEIGEPDLIEKRDKLYIADDKRIGYGNYMGYAIPEELIPLPVELKAEDDRQVIQFRIGDNLEKNEAREIWLRMKISNLTGEDELYFKLNGMKLMAGKESPSFDVCSIEYPLSSPPLKKGVNKLEVFLEKRNPLIEVPIEINTIEVSIKYK